MGWILEEFAVTYEASSLLTSSLRACAMPPHNKLRSSVGGNFRPCFSNRCSSMINQLIAIHSNFTSSSNQAELNVDLWRTSSENRSPLPQAHNEGLGEVSWFNPLEVLLVKGRHFLGGWCAQRHEWLL